MLHFDKYLAALATDTSTRAHVLLFAVICIETGIIALPFLPGDRCGTIGGFMGKSRHLIHLPV